MEDWLTTYEAAELSGYNLEYIRQLIRSRKIHARKWGQSWQVSQQSLEIYIGRVKKTGKRRGPKPKLETDNQ
jgi:excisionase family DNA binding protein